MGDVPGLKASHQIITENCREVQGGDAEAFEVAVERLRKEYLDTLPFHPKGKGTKFHLILSVEMT